MENILITGSNGQLGSEFHQRHTNYPYNFFFTDVNELDITNAEHIEKYIKQNSIHYIINCAGYTAVEKAESDIDTCFLLNKTAPGILAIAAAKNKTFLFHISSDYVFDGKNCIPYLETDTTNPVSVYGHSKLEGEIEILFNTKKAVIIRTSWLYSSFGNNFLKTIIQKTKEQNELKVVYDQIGTPTYARDLAKIILDIIPHVNKMKEVEIFNFSNEGVCSWYDFAKEIVDNSQLSCKISPVLSKEFPSQVKRPHFSVLNKEKIKTYFSIEIPYWIDSVKDCIRILKGE